MENMPPDVTTTTRLREGDVQGQEDPAASPVRADLLADPLQGLGLASGAALQMDETKPKPKPKPGDLSEGDAKDALAANKARRLRKRAWQTIATVVGSSEKALTVQLVQDLAAWQKRKGLKVDGRAGNITMQWLAMEPGGEKLDALVRGDHTVFLGIRKKSRGREARKLKGVAGRGNVSAVTGSDDKHEDQVKVGTKWEDLTTDPGIQALLATMPKLDAAKLKSLTAYIKDTNAKAKDEIAQLLQVLYRVEIGQGLMKRVVLSGHSGGEGIEDDDGTAITFAHVGKLNAIFPIAFAQVEDLMISGCNTGHKKHVPMYRKMFPNLKTIWAYSGYSPSGTSSKGSPVHIAKWSRDTKGRGEGKMDRGRKELTKRDRKNDKNVSAWSKTKGYRTDSPTAGKDLSDLIADLDRDEPAYTDAYTKGTIDRGKLNNLQTTLQVITRNFENDQLQYEHGRKLDDLKKMNRHVMFLRHWKEVSAYAVKKYGKEFRAGYDELGIPMPDFTKLSRTETLTKIKEYIAAMGKAKTPGPKAGPAYSRMADVLQDLDPSLIPLYR